MNSNELKTILEKHQLWLDGDSGGVRADLESANLESADLRSADLRSADLESANLRGANLRGANLESADLRGANLESADLRSADLRSADLESANLESADLRCADLRCADLCGADLRCADLCGADLWGANLRGANLRGANGNLKHLKSIFLETYPITYTATVLQIGCQHHAIADWWGFDDDAISQMDIGMLAFCKKWKTVLKTLIEMSPCEPTGGEQ